MYNIKSSSSNERSRPASKCLVAPSCFLPVQALRFLIRWENQCFVNATYVFFTHSLDDSDDEVFAVVKASLDFFTDFTVRKLHIILGVAFLVKEVQETVVDVHLMTRVGVSYLWMKANELTYELVFSTNNIRNVHVVGGRRQIFLENETEAKHLLRFD